MYADNEHKFIGVLNTKIEVPRLLNALGHLTAGLVYQCEDPKSMRFLRYEDANGGVHPAISHYPFIILAAKNGNQIRMVRQAAVEQGVLFNDFVDAMLGGSAEEQLRKTRITPEADLEYIGICLFGRSDVLNALTRKFSLFKG